MTQMDERLWSIGELAHLCGVTVRTLHHYDHIGLLPASAHTGSGHRRYTQDDVRCLYRIRALRSVGLSLEEVRTALGATPDDAASVRELLGRQLSSLREQARQSALLQQQIQSLLDSMGSALPDADRFLSILERMTVFEKYFTDEQRRELAEVREDLGAGVDAAKAPFTTLVEEGLGLLEAHVPAEDPRARQLAARWDKLGSAFHRDESTKAAARTMWEGNAPEPGKALPWPAEKITALAAYLQEARDAG